jgi:hypothetical protein
MSIPIRNLDIVNENNPVKRFFDNPNGFRAAINAMCATCVGCTAEKQGAGFKNHMEPGFRTTIKECVVTSCPLQGLRPYQATKTTSNVCRAGTG